MMSEQCLTCPEFLPAQVPDDRFCSPLECPDKIHTPRFASPNSGLPPAELARLKECIEQANQLLRTISNPRNPNNQTALRLHFKSLQGELVKVVVECGEEHLTVQGVLANAGRDFIQLNTIEKQVFILFEHICYLRRACGEPPHHEPELLCLDCCLRRCLVLNFSQTVSCRPDLANIFFGLPLHLWLLSFVGCPIELQTEDQQVLSGILADTSSEFLQLKINQELRQISWPQICLIKAPNVEGVT